MTPPGLANQADDFRLAFDLIRINRRARARVMKAINGMGLLLGMESI